MGVYVRVVVAQDAAGQEQRLLGIQAVDGVRVDGVRAHAAGDHTAFAGEHVGLAGAPDGEGGQEPGDVGKEEVGGEDPAYLGAWPMVASVPVLHTLGRHHAYQNLLTGDPFDARRAYEIGVVNEVVPAERLQAATDAWVDRVTRSTVLPVGRGLAERVLSLPYGEALDAALGEFTNLFTGSRR